MSFGVIPEQFLLSETNCFISEITEHIWFFVNLLFRSLHIEK